MEREVLTGIISGAAVAPLVSIVDKAIFSNASGKATFMESFKDSFMTVAKKPITFLKGPSFLWIWAVYGATYTVSNCTDRYIRSKAKDPAIPVLLATSSTNIGMSVLKDRAFSRMYGVVAPKPLPYASALCYGVRDFMTIAASFTMVPVIANHLQSNYNLEKSQTLLFAQMLCPLVAQIFNTPIFLLGMDLYNNPSSTTQQRISFIQAKYMNTFMLRLARIGPAFSIGGVVNRFLRDHFSAPINVQPSHRAGTK